ncbi:MULTISPECIES: glycoside hydrolase family 76 protein [Tsukamurella]|uniref:Fructose-bisphosphate aldolase n=2 Tax=Tsukamurella TaxID=2060 RepID=A0A5C5S5I2_9ACTN|nr:MULTISPECIES: glycoside hydrolase family 76 protein [Tsukamurella]NMD56821.1 fructose-bisphosphate aldolase [Tsukamurella columbiensis]TWS29725.1 fructose-bisphosphate aldolase [Tsukamurella conjunctivitidis]
MSSVEWNQRAAAAQAAVVERHLKPVWGIPGTLLGTPAYPATRRDALFVSWNYWWQAHLLDVAVDAYVRDGAPSTRKLVLRIARGHRLRNLLRVTNSYYDDMAWMGLALERAQRHAGLNAHRRLRVLRDVLYDAWVPDAGGGITWRTKGLFLNAPANGPAGIFLARMGRFERAEETSDWLYRRLLDLETGLINDGVDGDYDSPEVGKIYPEKYSYNQGVTIGLDTELSSDLAPTHAVRAAGLIAAVAEHMTEGDVIIGGDGGDGGLFNGILIRYLALAARSLRGPGAEDARDTASAIVFASAEAAWRGTRELDGRVLFSADWTRDARIPGTTDAPAYFTGGTVRSSETPERDLSVQVGGWMAMEAAAALARS